MWNVDCGLWIVDCGLQTWFRNILESIRNPQSSIRNLFFFQHFNLHVVEPIRSPRFARDRGGKTETELGHRIAYPLGCGELDRCVPEPAVGAAPLKPFDRCSPRSALFHVPHGADAIPLIRPPLEFCRGRVRLFR